MEVICSRDNTLYTDGKVENDIEIIEKRSESGSPYKTGQSQLFGELHTCPLCLFQTDIGDQLTKHLYNEHGECI